MLDISDYAVYILVVIYKDKKWFLKLKVLFNI